MIQFLFLCVCVDSFLALKWEVKSSSAAKCSFNISHATITSSITIIILNYMLPLLSSV